MHLALRVVEPSGAGPAVGAAIDRLVAVAVDGTAQLGSQQLDQLVPADLHELFGAASRAGPRAMLQPSAPYGGVGDAAAVTYRAGQVCSCGAGLVSLASAATAAMSPPCTRAVNTPQCVADV